MNIFDRTADATQATQIGDLLVEWSGTGGGECYVSEVVPSYCVLGTFKTVEEARAFAAEEAKQRQAGCPENEGPARMRREEKRRDLAVIGGIGIAMAASIAAMLVMWDNVTVVQQVLIGPMCGLVVCMWAVIWWLVRSRK